MTGVVFFLSESKFIYVIWTAPIIMQEELFGIVLLTLLRTTALLCSEKKNTVCVLTAQLDTVFLVHFGKLLVS